MRDFVSFDTWKDADKRIKTDDAFHNTKMLTQQLRELEEDGIVNRISYNQVPPKVEYELSEYGCSLKSILDSLCAWGERHIIKEYGDKSAVLEDNILNKL